VDLQFEVRDGAGDVPRARHAVSEALRDAAVRADYDAVELVVTELLTNALLHGSGPIGVHAVNHGDCVRIEVSDSAAEDVPHRVTAGPGSETGRGLLLVSVLAARWGVQPSDRGKTVWAEIDAAQPTSNLSITDHALGRRPPVEAMPAGQLRTTSQ
jgi:anti-sigma regulatory factor (Ser/Thr protein kinase)